MKGSTSFFVALLVIGTTLSCSKDEPDPTVATLTLNNGSSAELRKYALSQLSDFYEKSDKTREYYEIVVERVDNFIVNYNRGAEVLTVCGAGSGWSTQISKVSGTELKRLGALQVHIDSVAHFMVKDSSLTYTTTFIPVKTNGKPNG